MQFYDKEKELRDKNQKDDIIESAKGILRFEANITDKDLAAYSKDRWAGDLLTEKVAKYFLKKHLTRLKLDERLITSNRREVTDKLLQVYDINKTQTLLGFIDTVEMYGERLQKMMSESTYSNRIKSLISAGVNPRFSEKTLPPLDLKPILGD
jgi:hypothetical protein